MADPAAPQTLLQALQAGLVSPADSGYGIGAQVIASAAPSFQNPYASDSSNMVNSVGASLLAALLGGYAKHDANQENALVMQQMPALMAAAPGDRAAMAAGNPKLSPLVQALAWEDYSKKRALDDARAQKQLGLEFAPLEEAAKFNAKAPLENAQRADQKLIDMGADQGFIIQGGQKVPVGSLGLRTPQELKVSEATALEDAKRQSEVNALGFNPKREEEADKLRKEFSALPEVKNFAQVEKTASIIKEAIKDPSAMSDLELTRYAILLIEPGMAVREGEQAAVAGSQAIPDALKGATLKALNGEAALGPEAREGLTRLALRAYEGNKTAYDRALTFYQGQATAKGIDPGRVSYIGESIPADTLFGSSTGATPPPVDANVPPGMMLQRNSKGETRLVPQQ